MKKRKKNVPHEYSARSFAILLGVFLLTGASWRCAETQWPQTQEPLPKELAEIRAVLVDWCAEECGHRFEEHPEIEMQLDL